MLHVNFNTYNNYVTDSLYQWDKDQDLIINGLGLSVAPEVHFANANMDKAIVKQSNLSSNVVTVRIPNSILQEALTIKAYVGVYDNTTFNVIETIEIPVIPKAKPADYTLEVSDEEVYSFMRLENEIANLIINANKGDDYSEVADIRVGFNGKMYNSAGQAVRSQIESLDTKVQIVDNQIKRLNEVGLTLVEENVKEWLNEHPEATTTVQDESLGVEKLTDEAKLYLVKDYVTPEMFGAKGDGISDDSDAIQRAFDSGNTVVFKSRTYVINKGLLIKKSNFHLIGNNAVLILKGTREYACINVGNSSETLNNITIEKLTINSNGLLDGVNILNSDASTYRNCIALSDTNNVIIRDCVFYSYGVWCVFCGHSVNSEVNNGFTFTNNKIYSYLGNSELENLDTSALYIQSKNVVIADNTLISNDYNRTGLEMHNTYNMLISNNIVEGYNSAVILINEEIEDYKKCNTIVSNNIFKNVLTGVTLWGYKNYKLCNISIMNNNMDINPCLRGPIPGLSAGVMCYREDGSDYYIEDLKIENNTIKCTNKVTATNSDSLFDVCGISLTGYSYTYLNLTIKGNIISDFSGISIVCNSKKAQSNICIVDNVIYNPCNLGTINHDLDINAYWSAIRFSNFNNCTILNNYIVSNITLDEPVVGFGYTLLTSDDNTIINNDKSNKKYYSTELVMRSDSGNDGSNSYTQNSLIKIDNSLELSCVLDISTWGGGYGTYIELPYVPKYDQILPIVVYGLSSGGSNYYLDIKANNRIVYIWDGVSSLIGEMLSNGVKIVINGVIL